MKQFKTNSDAEIARHIRTGDKEAYRELFERYAPAIYNFAFSYLKTEVDSEGLVQDVFLKIWEKKDALNSSKNIKSYLFKIAVNSIYDIIRKKNIQHAFNDFARLNYTKAEDFTWHEVIYEDMLSQLNVLVAKLPEKQQQIFWMNKEEGLSNEEIAKKLNLSKRTVENQLYRALVFLKENFKNNSPLALLFILLYTI